MSDNRDPRLLYMMPAHFGATCGPRQTPDGGRYINHPPQKQRKLIVSFLTDAASLEKMLPPGFSLFGDPVVSVEMTELRDIAWLAGRGYNYLGVAFPASYAGASGRTDGLFLSVIWENLADPIITGREQLGYSKIFADIGDMQEQDGKITSTASWDGFEFVCLSASCDSLTEVDPATLSGVRPGEGILHHKYIPETGGVWESADADYVTLSPWQWDELDALDHPPAVPIVRVGEGEVAFREATWEQMPTQFRIVNALAKLPQIKNLEAIVIRTESSLDYRNQRRL